MTKKEIRQEMTRGAIWLIFAFGLAMVTRGISIKDSDKVAFKEELEKKAYTEDVLRWDKELSIKIDEGDEALKNEIDGNYIKLVDHIDRYHMDVIKMIELSRTE